VILLDLAAIVVVVVLMVGFGCWVVGFWTAAKEERVEEARRFANYYVSTYGKVRERRDG
jgi:hypothetical protein